MPRPSDNQTEPLFPADRVKRYAEALESDAAAGKVYGIIALEDRGPEGIHLIERGSLHTKDARIALLMQRISLLAILGMDDPA